MLLFCFYTGFVIFIVHIFSLFLYDKVWPIISKFLGDSGVSSPGPSSEASLSSQKNSDLSYMDRVVMEVIESESVYVRDLQQVVEVMSNVNCPKRNYENWFLFFHVLFFFLFFLVN